MPIEQTSSIYIRNRDTNTRLTFTQMSLYFIMLFPITTLLQGYISVINKALFAATLIVMFIAIMYKANRATLVAGAITVAMHFLPAIRTSYPLYNTNDIFYFAFWIMLVFFVSNKKEVIDSLIEKSKNYIVGVITVWTILIAVAMVMPSSYPYSYLYFKPYGLSGFRSGPTALFILTLILVSIVYFKNKRYIFFSVFPMFVLFMGSSRTYFGVGILLFAIIWYVVCDKTDKFFITAVPIAIVGIIFYQVAGISDKVTETTTWSSDMYFDYWATLTNGRSIFWEADLDAFANTSLIRKLFGNSFNYVYNVNNSAIGALIWAHNDFIQVLLTFGLFGVAFYIYSYVHLCRNVLFKNKTKIPILVFLLFFFVWLVNAFFNMFYTYFCSCISYPFIAFALNRYFSEKGDGQFFKTKDEEEKPKSKYIR